jgi:hypothetical protein
VSADAVQDLLRVHPSCDLTATLDTGLGTAVQHLHGLLPEETEELERDDGCQRGDQHQDRAGQQPA